MIVLMNTHNTLLFTIQTHKHYIFYLYFTQITFILLTKQPQFYILWLFIFAIIYHKTFRYLCSIINFKQFRFTNSHIIFLRLKNIYIQFNKFNTISSFSILFQKSFSSIHISNNQTSRFYQHCYNFFSICINKTTIRIAFIINYFSNTSLQ